MDVQQHAVFATPVGEPGVGAETAGEEIVHDDGHVERLGECSPLVHLFGRRRRAIEVVSLALAGLGLRLFHCLGDELEAVLPAHEGLRVDVLVVLGEVQAATQTLVNAAPVVLRRQAQLRLDRTAKQGAPILIQSVALDV